MNWNVVTKIENGLGWATIGSAGAAVLIRIVSKVVSGSDWWGMVLLGMCAVAVWSLELVAVGIGQSRVIWKDMAYIGALLALAFFGFVDQEETFQAVGDFLFGLGLLMFIGALFWGIPATLVRRLRKRRRIGQEVRD